jgi:FMN-dependent NADH-azoreductase
MDIYSYRLGRNLPNQEFKMRLLRIDSSGRTASVTRQLTARFAEEWKTNHPHGDVMHRDLSATPLPLITDDWSATNLEPSKQSPAQRSYLSTSDELIEELLAADTFVIGAPMYNSSISSSLKAWIDQIVRIGKTFSYGPSGPRGLLERKKVVVITARGGSYDKGTPKEAFDFQEPYLRHVFGLLGLTDVTFIHAENQLREQAGASFAAAVERIAGIVADRPSLKDKSSETLHGAPLLRSSPM